MFIWDPNFLDKVLRASDPVDGGDVSKSFEGIDKLIIGWIIGVICGVMAIIVYLGY